MKNVIKAVLALGIVAAGIAFAPNVKIQIDEPSAAACEPASGSGCY